ncbi:flagellar hook assembly protein FlgD [Calditrichota bacterium LG25]
MGDLINSITNTNIVNSAQQNAISDNADLGKYEFLQLLVTQLKNQDPLSPMQSQDFAAQLAQFSSLERLMDIDSSLQQGMEADMLLAQTIHNTMATTFIGKEVLAYGDSFSLLSGESASLSFELNGSVKEATIEIYDENDQLVRTIKMTELEKGRHSVEWDGMDEAGNALNGGVYHFKVKAIDEQDNAVTAQTFTRGIVSAVKYEQGQPVLLVDGKEIYFGEVVQIG